MSSPSTGLLPIPPDRPDATSRGGSARTARGASPGKNLEKSNPADAALEVAQLHDTIVAMREQMEKLAFERQRAVQEAVAGSTTENQQLRATVQALREELEQMKHRYEAEIQAVRTAEREEQKQLHAVILTLREQLERA